MLNPNIESEFKKTFKLISPNKRRLDVFRDFIKMSALTLYNAFVRSEKIEEEFSVVRKQYTDQDYQYIKDLFQITVDALEQKPHDFFGNIYMSLELGDSNKGQYFTPFCVSQLLASITLSNQIDETITKQGYIKVSEPACGSGSMIIAIYQKMRVLEYNPQTQLYVECIDIDPTVAMMCYIQLSLLGVPAKVEVGNALTLEINRVFYTPFYFIGEWSKRFRLEKTVEKMKSFMSLISGSETVNETVQEKPLIKPITINSSIKFDKESQISLF